MPDYYVPVEDYTVHFATNTFVRVPIIVMSDGEPLLRVVTSASGGLDCAGRLYNADGVKLAAWVGRSLKLTEEGKNAGVELRHFPDVIVLEQDGKARFELRRPSPTVLNPTIELYSPTGLMLRGSPEVKGLLGGDGAPLRVGSFALWGNTFSGCQVGVVIENGVVRSIGAKSFFKDLPPLD
jgi:hypothetical protein